MTSSCADHDDTEQARPSILGSMMKQRIGAICVVLVVRLMLVAIRRSDLDRQALSLFAVICLGMLALLCLAYMVMVQLPTPCTGCVWPDSDRPPLLWLVAYMVCECSTLAWFLWACVEYVRSGDEHAMLDWWLAMCIGTAAQLACSGWTLLVHIPAVVPPPRDLSRRPDAAQPPPRRRRRSSSGGASSSLPPAPPPAVSAPPFDILPLHLFLLAQFIVIAASFEWLWWTVIRPWDVNQWPLHAVWTILTVGYLCLWWWNLHILVWFWRSAFWFGLQLRNHSPVFGKCYNITMNVCLSCVGMFILILWFVWTPYRTELTPHTWWPWLCLSIHMDVTTWFLAMYFMGLARCGN